MHVGLFCCEGRLFFGRLWGTKDNRHPHEKTLLGLQKTCDFKKQYTK